MSTAPLVVITTRLPPQVCGIGTHSWLLDRHWPAKTSLTQFLVIDGAASSGGKLNHRAITQFNGSGAALARALDRMGSSNIVLHYAGRAYNRFGCPFWLPAVIEKWKARFPAGRLLIFFHELPGNASITSRHFLIDKCNTRVIHKLAKVADVLVTNTRNHALKLQEISDRKDIHVVPVGSNISAPQEVDLARARTEFVIFGLPFGRWQTLQMFDTDLRHWQECGLLTRLHLIGPADRKFKARAARIIGTWADPSIVVEHGMLVPEQISEILRWAQFGLLNITSDSWSKSGAFMALASHGCNVVTKAKSTLEPLRFAISADEVSTISDPDLFDRARDLKNWYQRNATWEIVARRVSHLLEGGK